MASQPERLSGALQENILTLLCFSDSACKLIRTAVGAQMFESSVYREIAAAAIDFVDQYGEAIKTHLPDVLEHILKGSDASKATLFTRTLDNLFAVKDSLNTEYVLSCLEKFVRQQAIKTAIIEAVDAIDRGELDVAEAALEKSLRTKATIFDPGTYLTDLKRSLAFLDSTDSAIHLGIPELDRREIGPREQELFLIIAPPKRGKTWGLVHVGKMALVQRRRVLHVTLEMSEDRVAQRYFQSFFSLSKREAIVRITSLEKDDDGRVVNFTQEDIERISLRDPNIRKIITSRVTRDFRKRPPLVIKQFPTGALTIPALDSYLDSLARYQKFHPDVIVVDYPDLMSVDAGNVRVDTGRLYKELRGIGVERNVAMVVASQGNRESSSARLITDSMVAEDYSKIATADNVITYNQTEHERNLGLARLFVSNGRNDEDKFTVLITQKYAIGQFCLDSALMTSDPRVQRMLNESPDDE